MDVISQAIRLPGLEARSLKLDEIVLPSQVSAITPRLDEIPNGELHVGVDLGTAYLVLVVLDHRNQLLAGEYQFAQVVRDGLVFDFYGAVELLIDMKHRIENRLGRSIEYAATGFPPGVPQVEVQATANVLEAAGLTCTGLIGEPSAANNVLKIQSGAIVDVGGGTTGIAVIKDREVIHTADEPTGGTHFSLVIAGALGISFEEAETRKIQSSEQTKLFPSVKPVMEKVGEIIRRNTSQFKLDHLTLVGGASAFQGMVQVIETYTGIPTSLPEYPMFVTPVGIAMHCQPNALSSINGR